jgi:hypothetical protein
MLIEMLAVVCELSPHCQAYFGSCLQYPFCHHQQETPEVLVISYLKMWNFVKEAIIGTSASLGITSKRPKSPELPKLANPEIKTFWCHIVLEVHNSKEISPNQTCEYTIL